MRSWTHTGLHLHWVQSFRWRLTQIRGFGVFAEWKHLRLQNREPSRRIGTPIVDRAFFGCKRHASTDLYHEGLLCPWQRTPGKKGLDTLDPVRATGTGVVHIHIYTCVYCVHRDFFSSLELRVGGVRVIWRRSSWLGLQGTQ